MIPAESPIYYEITLGLWGNLMARLAQRYQIAINDKLLGQVCKAAIPNGDIKRWADPEWSNGSWHLWLKNRLDEMGVFQSRGEYSRQESVVTAVLHIFFIGLDEDDDMLALLHNEKTALPRSLWYASSRAFKDLTVLNPIDRTAARVVVRPYSRACFNR